MKNNAKNVDKYYFKEEQQKAVINYRDAFKYENDNFHYLSGKRNKIYIEYLHEPFNKMVNAIIRRYSHLFDFGNYSIEEMEHMAIQHLIEQFTNFDEWKPDILRYSTTKKDVINKLTNESEYHFYVLTDSLGKIKEIVNINIDIDELLENINKNLIDKQTISKNNKIELKLTYNNNDKNKDSFDLTTVDNSNDYDLTDYYISRNMSIDEVLYPHIDIPKIAKKNVIYKPINEPRSSFSYCQTIVKNFFNTQSKNNYLEKKRDNHYEYVSDLEAFNDVQTSLFYEDQHDLDNILEKNPLDIMLDFFEHENDTNEFLTDEEKYVGDSLIDILKDWENVMYELTPKGHTGDKVSNVYIKRKIVYLISEMTRIGKDDVKKILKKRYKKIYDNVKPF